MPESEFDAPPEAAQRDDGGRGADSGAAQPDSSPRDRRNPLSRRQPINRGRHLSRQFFEEGERQQESDWENSPLAVADAARDNSIDFKSFDEVPSRRGPLVVIAVAAVAAVVGLVGWTIFGVASSSSAPVDQSAAALLQIQAPQALEKTPPSATVLPPAIEVSAAAAAATASPGAVTLVGGPASPRPVLEVPVGAARTPKAPVNPGPVRRLAPAVVARAQPSRKTASVKPAALFKKAQPLARTKAQPARPLTRAGARPVAPSSSPPGALLPAVGDGAAELSPPASEAPSLIAPAVTTGASEAPSAGEAAVPSEASAAAADRAPAPPPLELAPPSTARPEPTATPDLLEPAPAE